MTNFAEVLTVLAAGGGLGVLLVMAAVPLLLDPDAVPSGAELTGALRLAPG